jgi:uncharacterized protein YgiM (DUF1202 family)
MMKKFLLILVCGIVVASCTPQQDSVAVIATTTLLPIPSQQPRYTETPVSTRTPLPTFTYTPTLTPIPPTITNTPIPTATPTVAGIVQSIQRVNVREGPGVEFGELEALAPGTGVQVIGQNADGTWFNIRLEDGREGWISAKLLFIAATSTPFAPSTLIADANSLLTNPLPTSILGGGTVTPTPPSVITTATPAQAVSPTARVSPSPTQPLVPIVSAVPNVNLSAIQSTATALAQGAATATPSITPVAGSTERILTVATSATSDGSNILTQTSATVLPTLVPTGLPGTNNPNNVDVFAFCDENKFGAPAPSSLRNGQTIDIWWGWYAKTESQVRDQIANAQYDVRVNGQPVANVGAYVTDIRKSNADFVAFWYIPYGPLATGNYEITYVVTWTQAITDGYDSYGPGTNIPFEQHACSFTVR